MVFLDFFEALLGCAEVYVVDASEQTDVPVTTSGEQRPSDTATEITTEQTATPLMSHSHSTSLVEQVGYKGYMYRITVSDLIHVL